MKILYAIQGTGNGHLSRSMDVVPCLKQHGDVDVLVSGIQGDLSLPFDIKYKLNGLSFIFGKKGGVALWKTVAKTNVRKFLKGMQSLPVDDYDLVINDFEPVSAWACYARHKKCIALSHQAAVLAPESPRPEHTDLLGRIVLGHYAPSSHQYGFHFQEYSPNIFTPVIRREIRDLDVENRSHITVYLPSYDDGELVRRLSRFQDVTWDVFSKHNRRRQRVKNVSLQPVESDSFIRSMATSSGVLCGAGFETPAEALFLGKKLLVIPMKNQYEQHLNAAALAQLGVPVIRSLKEKHHGVINDWLYHREPIHIDYPDRTAEIVARVIGEHSGKP